MQFRVSVPFPAEFFFLVSKCAFHTKKTLRRIGMGIDPMYEAKMTKTIHIQKISVRVTKIMSVTIIITEK